MRPAEADLFGYGSRESVLAAVLAATGHQAAYERLVLLEGRERVDAVLELIGAERRGRRPAAARCSMSISPRSWPLSRPR